MKKTLLILAAGIGSRFGRGVKQLTPVGPNGELIIDYSIHDAISAGFNKIVFIIRHSIEQDFKEVIGARTENLCTQHGIEVAYAFQELEDIPTPVIDGRVKPWGTGQAVLACRNILDEPFAVINADDYYGVDSFVKASDFLENNFNGYALVGYILKNTLSKNGGVTRGICSVENGKLTGISETRNIIALENGAEAHGVPINITSIVSMNFWCFPKSFLNLLETGFSKFLAETPDKLKDEYLLPIIADSMLKSGTQIDVLHCSDKWLGITYKEDVEHVVQSIQRFYSEGKYKNDLYSDLF